MSVAQAIAAAGAGAWIGSGIVTEIATGYATVNLGAKYVQAKIPGHLLGVVTVGASAQIIGDENYRVIIGVLSALPWITTGFSAASGWSIDYAGYRWTVGPQISLIMRVLRTGATITASASGHLVDETVATAPVGLLPPSWPINSIPFVWRTSWSIGGGYLGPTSGNLVLCDLHPTASITAGDQMQMQVTYSV